MFTKNRQNTKICIIFQKQRLNLIFHIFSYIAVHGAGRNLLFVFRASQIITMEAIFGNQLLCFTISVRISTLYSWFQNLPKFFSKHRGDKLKIQLVSKMKYCMTIASSIRRNSKRIVWNANFLATSANTPYYSTKNCFLKPIKKKRASSELSIVKPFETQFSDLNADTVTL